MAAVSRFGNSSACNLNQRLGNWDFLIRLVGRLMKRHFVDKFPASVSIRISYLKLRQSYHVTAESLLTPAAVVSQNKRQREKPFASVFTTYKMESTCLPSVLPVFCHRN